MPAPSTLIWERFARFHWPLQRRYAGLAWDQGLAQYAEPQDIRQYVRDCMYHPEYRPYIAA